MRWGPAMMVEAVVEIDPVLEALVEVKRTLVANVALRSER
jgi:hypothetical protein